MKTEVRFVLAVLLMLIVLIGTNVLFPPLQPEEQPEADPVSRTTPPAGAMEPTLEPPGEPEVAVPAVPVMGEEDPTPAPRDPNAGRIVTVEGPLFRYSFTTLGARLESAELNRFISFTRDGAVELLPQGTSAYMGQRVVVGADTIDLSRVLFESDADAAVTLRAGGPPQSLRFTYQHPTHPLRLELSYGFQPESYEVYVSGRLTGVERPLLVTDLGDGLAYNEADSLGEARAMAYVGNHLQNGIKSTALARADAPRVDEGPFLWAAFRSKFFVLALLAGDSTVAGAGARYLGGMLIAPSDLPDRARVHVTQSVRSDGRFEYRLFLGPQELALLSSLGQDLEEVNPYGWRFFRPIVRPFVSIITTILVFLHTQLSLGYGWVLVVFGVAMRIVLFPLNHKAMKAQLRNMAVQPLVQEVQAKHKENPERLQKEMMKLYKEHGFNPFAGCLPMLLPWPVLIALFFVFQNTIELRGEPFLWLPDLSAADPLYILPIFLGISMFLMQWVSLRSLEQTNQQMKMMMYVMPVMMVFIFFRLASGLNLYYAVANIATIPQQVWIARERKKVLSKTPVTANKPASKTQ